MCEQRGPLRLSFALLPNFSSTFGLHVQFSQVSEAIPILILFRGSQNLELYYPNHVYPLILQLG